MALTKQSGAESNASRKMTYALPNLNFYVLEMYSTRKYVTEIHRIAFTRLGVCDHSLAVETSGAGGASPWKSGCASVVPCRRNGTL